MIKKPKIPSAICSTLLLMAFSFTNIPPDIFHHQQVRAIVCKSTDKVGTYPQKVDLSVKPLTGWLCSIRFDKKNSITFLVQKYILNGKTAERVTGSSKDYLSKKIFSSRRGPTVC